jgi:hypothetical protein
VARQAKQAARAGRRNPQAGRSGSDPGGRSKKFNERIRNEPVFTQNHPIGYTRPFHGAHGAFAHPPLLSAARVRALLEVRAVTDPSWSAAGNHRNWKIVQADLLEREIAPGVGYGRNVTAVSGSCNEFWSEQLFVTQISTRFEWHDSGCDSSEATAD